MIEISVVWEFYKWTHANTWKVIRFENYSIKRNKKISMILVIIIHAWSSLSLSREIFGNHILYVTESSNCCEFERRQRINRRTIEASIKYVKIWNVFWVNKPKREHSDAYFHPMWIHKASFFVFFCFARWFFFSFSHRYW